MSEELIPCPFCGEEKNLEVQLAAPFFMIEKYKNRYMFAGCKSCGATTVLINAFNKTGSPLLNTANTKTAKEKAINLWNSRTEKCEAYWQVCGDAIFCTKCYESAPLIKSFGDTIWGRYLSNYCPNCGSKMVGEVQTNE